MRYTCCTDTRRALVEASALNGIDFVDVLDGPDVPDDERQRSLFVHFVKPLAAPLPPERVRIEGGERIKGIRVVEVVPTDDPSVVRVDVDRAGDFSVYTLRLVADPLDAVATDPPEGIDPVLAAVEVRFKLDCPTPFDCDDPRPCPPDGGDGVAMSYLAKDYASFRALLFDRLATLSPQWRERSPADVGVALVELFAYVGDRLSYTQDAVATEAYLHTARRRISVRRHVRLVDYVMHDGANARTWVQVRVEGDVVPGPGETWEAVAAGTPFLTKAPTAPPALMPTNPNDAAALRRALEAGVEVFEAVLPVRELRVDHNDLAFYTWGGQRCCLPEGSVDATLHGAHLTLRRGEVLVLAELPRSESGETAGEAEARRHPVRLVADAVTGVDPVTGVEYTTVQWGPDDALPFPLCVTRTGEGGEEEQAGVAWGNIVLVDHGATVGRLAGPSPAVLGPVPGPALAYAPEDADPCRDLPRATVPARFRPVLAHAPVTQAGTVLLPPGPDGVRRRVAADPDGPAAAALRVDRGDVRPAVRLIDSDGRVWDARPDLLDSDAASLGFVVEVDDDQRAHLRFGDGTSGAAPPEGAEFLPSYRVGNGTAGNVGVGAIAHVVAVRPETATAVSAVANVLPGVGGVDPETIDQARRDAPVAFRTQRRAVTPADYERVAREFPGVQQAVATMRWTGSWHTVFLTVDRLGGLAVDAGFEAGLRAWVDRFRMAGHDIEVDGPVYVPLELALTVCVDPAHLRAHVHAAVREAVMPAFAPDRLTFGQSVYLSPVVAAAQSVPGVTSVTVSAFRRWGDPAGDAAETGRLDLGRLEIARLANDPNFEDRGVLRLTMAGGR